MSDSPQDTSTIVLFGKPPKEYDEFMKKLHTDLINLMNSIHIRYPGMHGMIFREKVCADIETVINVSLPVNATARKLITVEIIRPSVSYFIPEWDVVLCIIYEGHSVSVGNERPTMSFRFRSARPNGVDPVRLANAILQYQQ